MNAIYSYNPQEASAIFINRIYYLLELNHWSVKTLSDKSDIPYETLKKLLARKIENTSIHNIIKIASAFHCNIDDLVGPYATLKNQTSDISSDSYYQGCVHTRLVWNYFYEIDRSFDLCESNNQKTSIPLLNPVSNNLTTALQEISTPDLLDISFYPASVRAEADCGIKICTYCYHPTYCNNDILLVSRKRSPISGETAILLHHGEIYIRRFFPSSKQIILEAVNGIGNDIVISDFSDWILWGYVVGIYRF